MLILNLKLLKTLLIYQTINVDKNFKNMWFLFLKTITVKVYKTHEQITTEKLNKSLCGIYICAWFTYKSVNQLYNAHLISRFIM